MTAGPQLTRYGRIISEDQYHAIILRGDINYSPPNYTVVGGQAVTTFVQFGGTWRFRHVNSGSNVLLCEITPDNILYKNVALQRIPHVSCRVSGNTGVLNSVGQVTPTVESAASGYRTVTFGNHPAGVNFTPMVTLTSGGRIVVAPPTIASSVEVIT